MKSRTFSPIVLHKKPLETSSSSSSSSVFSFSQLPKVTKQECLSFSDMNPSEDYSSSSESSDESSDSSDEEEDDDEDDDDDSSEEPELYTQKQQPVDFPTNNNNAMEYMNKMTLDLMMNPHYLSKVNPEAFQRKVEEAQRILKHKREIYKTMDDCFDALGLLAAGVGDLDVDLDVQTGFLHFAKNVLLNTQQQNRVGKSDTEPIFSVCNDSHSSFMDERR